MVHDSLPPAAIRGGPLRSLRGDLVAVSTGYIGAVYAGRGPLSVLEIGTLPRRTYPSPSGEFVNNPEISAGGQHQGTLGESLMSPFTIEEKIVGRLPVTIQLGVMAIVIGLVIALPVGIYSAIRQDTAADYAGRSIAIIGLATPNFWLGIMVMIYPTLWWGWTPPMELVALTEDPLGNLGVFIVPSLILGTASAAATMRMTRTMMLEVLRQDYIRTAWSKGLRERVVVMRHAVKNALIPVVTLIGLQLPILIGGSVIMENIFNLPGLGRLLLTALDTRDYPVVSGINLVFATAVVLFNLLIDLLCSWLDPRVRYD